MSELREFTGAFIPAKIWLDEKMTPAEKMLLGEIKALSEKTGWCYANNAHFAKWLHCNTPNVSMYIAKMLKAGYIDVTYADKKTHEGRKIRVNIQWYHGCKEDSAPFNGIEAPFNHTVPPFNGIEAPFNGIETEREFKATFNSDDNDNGGKVENFDTWINSIPTDQTIREAFFLSRKIPPSRFDELYNLFCLEAKTKKETYHTRRMVTDHFLNFAASKHERAQRAGFNTGGAPSPQPTYRKPEQRAAVATEEPKYRK